MSLGRVLFSAHTFLFNKISGTGLWRLSWSIVMIAVHVKVPGDRNRALENDSKRIISGFYQKWRLPYRFMEKLPKSFVVRKGYPADTK
jgi:hypothetical protein